MDYEKKYKEALSFLKDLKPYMSDYCTEKLEGFFPELSESEDEKIRKELLEHCLNRRDGKQICVDASDYRRWAVWLEKQGEQKPVEWDYPYGENETIDKLMAIAECLEMDEGFLYNGYTGTECVKFLRDLARKQIECKPTDEIKLKLNIGDWITNGEYTWNVTDIQPLDYILQSPNGVVVYDAIFYVDEHFHLWTIQDAKDGDVLAFYNEYKGNKMVQVGIIEKYVGKHGGCSNTFKIYAGVNWENNLQIGEYMGCSDIRPATQEQRDLLFQKMKKLGYEWNAEKKELKKLEQTSARSEENEERIEFLIAMCDDEQAECVNNSTMYRECTETKDWLKSIKLNHWKPSKEQMNALNKAKNSPANYHDIRLGLQSLYNDLARL